MSALRPAKLGMARQVYVPVLLWLLLASTGLTSVAQVSAEAGSAKGTRSAADFPGASIVERVQAAIRDCGPNPCEVYIPAGTYNSSPVASWKNRDGTGTRVGIAIPSNVEIRGAGKGHTIIQVTRSAGDPAGTLFANANESNRNIRLRDMSIAWTDSSSTYDWVSRSEEHTSELQSL